MKAQALDGMGPKAITLITTPTNPQGILNSSILASSNTVMSKILAILATVRARLKKDLAMRVADAKRDVSRRKAKTNVSCASSIVRNAPICTSQSPGPGNEKLSRVRKPTEETQMITYNNLYEPI